MIQACIYLTAFVVVLSIIVLVHEGGHFFVARCCGVQVEEFSIGFGKTLFSRKDKKGTLWKIGAIPLGGYVKMLGDGDAASMTQKDTKIPASERKKMFLSKPRWQRALIIAAGPGMNYFFAWIVLAGMLLCIGEAIVPPVVGEVMPGLPAERAGIVSGDRILTMNQKGVESYRDILRFVLAQEKGQPLAIQVQREGKIEDIIIPKLEEVEGTPMLGIKSSPKVEIGQKKFSLLAALGRSGQIIGQTTWDMVVYLKQMILHKRSAKEMRGPLGIAEASGDALLGGGLTLLLFIVNISIAVGFMNLLPIPLLDGGHLAMYLVEGLTGRSVSVRLQTVLVWVGCAVLGGLLVFTLVLDIPRIVQRIFG